MSRKDFVKKIASKLEQIRKTYRLSVTGMATKLNIHVTSCARHENCRSLPGIFTLYKLGNALNISLNWLILDKGPMYIPEKTEEKKALNDILSNQPLTDDVKELLDCMGKVPLLRYEILSQFHRFKEEHREIMERGLQPQAEKL
jgi:DNA-binding XRE family transcriptional regulator